MNLYSLRYANGKELCVKYKKSVYQSLVGALAGFRNCYIVAKKIYESDDKKHDKET